MQTKPTETSWDDLSALLNQGFREDDPEMIEALKNCPADVREIWATGVAEAGFIIDNQ
jgi:hypothetical protein